MKLLISIFLVTVLILWDWLWLPRVKMNYALWASNIVRLLTWSCGFASFSWLLLNLVALGEAEPPASRLHIGFLCVGAGLGLIYGLVDVFIKSRTKINPRR
jgi:hypothetical protein